MTEPAAEELREIEERLQRIADGGAISQGLVEALETMTEELRVANALAEAEIASEIYSTAGDYDLLVKFYVDNDTAIGHFVNEKVQVIPGIQDTLTIITFKAFGTG